MKTTKLRIEGLLLIEPKVFGDARGFFVETYNAKRYAEVGLADQFVQDNLSFSARGVLRGLHFQEPCGQGKLVSVLQGEVYDVAVDIRLGSPTFGQWLGVTLNGENKHQFYVPPGFAHGFVATRDDTFFSYKCTQLYQPENEGSILWNDPALGIPWPVAEPSLAAKDKAGICLADFPRERLPKYIRPAAL